MLKRAKLWLPFVALVFLIAAYFITINADISITLNGKPLHGLKGAGAVIGSAMGTVLSLLAALALAALVFSGMSFVVIGSSLALLLIILVDRKSVV